MFLDDDIHKIMKAKADLSERAELRRQTLRLEVQSLRNRVSRNFNGLALAFQAGEKALSFLSRHWGHRCRR